MSLYEAAKDAVKLAQKVDNVELVQKLLDVQQQALEMQEKQHNLNKKIVRLEEEVTSLKAKKKYIYEEGHDWIIDPESPNRKLCPVCFNRDKFENPLEYSSDKEKYCRTCKKYVT